MSEFGFFADLHTVFLSASPNPSATGNLLKHTCEKFGLLICALDVPTAP